MSDDMLPPVIAALKANIDDFKSKMGEAKSEMTNVESSGKSHFAAIGAAAAAGFAALAAGAIEVGKKSIEAFNDTAKGVRNLQLLTGESAESMSHLAFAAEETGVSQEKLEGALKKMSKAVEGNQKAFEAHNIATKDANGNLLPMSDIIANASDVFAKMPDGIEKNTLAMQLFGKSGTDLIPLLNQGKDGLANFGEEADKFGITIGQDGVDAYKKNVQNSREMHAAMKGLEVQIGEKLMPIVTKITTWLAANLPIAIEFVKKVIEKLTPAFQAVGDGIAWLATWFQNHWDQISAIVENVVGYIRGTIETFVGVVEAVWNNFGDNIIQYLQGAWEIVSGVFKGAFEVIEGLFDFFRDLFTGKWGKLWGDVKQILQGVWDAISGYIRGTLDQIEAIFGAAWTVIKTAVSLVWDGIKEYFQLWWSVVKAIFETELAAIKWVVTTIFDGIKAAISAVWDGIRTAASTAWDLIKAAVSGPVTAIKLIIGGIADAAGAIWNGIESAASTVWNAIKKAIDTPIGLIKDAINAVPKAFKSMWNDIAGWWNNSVGSFSFSIPSWVPGLGGDGFDMPNLPTFHTGGVVPGAPGQNVLALVAGRERILTDRQNDDYERAMRAGDSKPPVQQVNNFHGITDHQALARTQARELAWLMKVA